MLVARSFIVFIGLFCVMEGLPAGLLYQRLIRNSLYGKDVIEIFYNGVEPPRCEDTTCKPMDDAELTEYLRKSVMEGSIFTKRVPVIRRYPLSDQEKPQPINSQEQPTTTENLFISQEEEEEDDDNNY